jgi:capsular exopolysaccharide synthesis family protein
MIKQDENISTVTDFGSNNGISSSGGMMSENLIQVVWRSRWVILVTTIASLAMAFIYVLKATPIYTSTSRIYVEQSGPKILTEVEGVMTQSKNYLYTQAELLRSTPILSAALEKPGVKQMRIFHNVDNIVAFLKKKALNIEVGRKDDIISISSDSPDPAEAAHLVNAVVDSYITYHATRKRSTSAEILKILRTEKDKRSTELSDKLQTMMDFKKEHEALAFESRQGNLVIERLERLSSVLTEAQLSTIEAESNYETIKEMISDPIKLKQYVESQRTTTSYLSTEHQKTELDSKLEQLEVSLANRSREVTSGHPAVIAYKNDIERIKRQIEDLDVQFAEAQLAVAEQQYLAARDRENQIAEYYDDQRQQTLALNEQLAQYTILQSDWEQTKKLCDILDERIKELNVTEDVGALNISILEAAHPATTPSAPQKSKYMALALVLGLMLGGGLALLRDWMDQKLHSAEEISTVLGVPVLGVVPSMSRREDVAERGRKVYLDSKSSWAEAYRTIRTAVFFGAPKGEAKTILVTSPAPSDGKTTLVSNLAIAMAQAGQKTLILDADFRKPMQHNVFRINHEHIGLSSVMAGATNLREAIHSTEINGLDILTRGPEVPNPSEILNSSSFAKLLKHLENTYDRIIIDSPPVIPVTDAQIIAAICDITLLVLRAEKSTRKISQQARDGLLSVGAHMLGVVVNDVPRKGRYGYYGSYGNYGSYYGSEINQKRDTVRKPVVVG